MTVVSAKEAIVYGISLLGWVAGIGLAASGIAGAGVVVAGGGMGLAGTVGGLALVLAGWLVASAGFLGVLYKVVADGVAAAR